MCILNVNNEKLKGFKIFVNNLSWPGHAGSRCEAADSKIYFCSYRLASECVYCTPIFRVTLETDTYIKKLKKKMLRNQVL